MTFGGKASLAHVKNARHRKASDLQRDEASISTARHVVTPASFRNVDRSFVMSMKQVRRSLALVATAFAVTASYAFAEQNTENKPTGDIKPAQTDSPAAHPVSSPNNNERQVTDRSENGRRTTTQSTRGDTTRRATNRGDRTEGDLERQLASCLLTKNKGEVELGKYAADRAKNSDVKEFAEQMVKDHSKMAEKLEQIVGSQEPNDQRSQIGREIDEQCMASLKKELASKSGKDFDACYVGSQISGHMHMAATLKVVSDHASGKLSEVVSEARPTVEKHLAHAKKLMEEVDKSRDQSQATKDRNDRTR
jgi:putative membrane protein